MSQYRPDYESLRTTIQKQTQEADLEPLTTAEKVELATFMKRNDVKGWTEKLSPYNAPARKHILIVEAHKELLYLRHINQERQDEARQTGKEPVLLTKEERALNLGDGFVCSTYRKRMQEQNALIDARDLNNAALEALGGRAHD